MHNTLYFTIVLWSRELLSYSCTDLWDVCPPLRLQHRALSLLQPDRSVPAPAEHLHQQQQHIRRHVYNYREPRRAGERGGKTREAPTSPSPCSAPKQTLKVGSHWQHALNFTNLLCLTFNCTSRYSLNAKYNVTELT